MWWKSWRICPCRPGGKKKRKKARPRVSRRRAFFVSGEEGGLHRNVLPGDPAPVKACRQLPRGDGGSCRLLSSQLGQQADELLRRIPPPEGAHVQIGIPLGQPSTVGGQQEGDVVKLGGLQSQGLIEPKLPGGGGEQVPAPDHLGDPHFGVVHHHRQLISPGAVTAADRKIAALPGQVLAVGALKSVGKEDGLRGHPHPPAGGVLPLRSARRRGRRGSDRGRGGPR